MLELRPTCENCHKLLPPSATDAMICSYECTFCSSCVVNVLENVCPNCAGGFVPRPIRPKNNWRGDSCLSKDLASIKIKYKPINIKDHQKFAAKIKGLLPQDR